MTAAVNHLDGHVDTIRALHEQVQALQGELAEAKAKDEAARLRDVLQATTAEYAEYRRLTKRVYVELDAAVARLQAEIRSCHAAQLNAPGEGLVSEPGAEPRTCGCGWCKKEDTNGVRQLPEAEAGLGG